jgi:hypothetical protein
VRWFRRRRTVAKRDSADELAAAEREVELSRQRLRDTHEQVVKPLRAVAAQNSFAEIIAASLRQGHRNGGPR